MTAGPRLERTLPAGVVDAHDGLDEVERCPDGALGIVLARDRRAPDRHHGVPDELLDGPAVALDHRSGLREVATLERLDGLRIDRFGGRGEADEVGEQDGHQSPFGRPDRVRLAGRGAPTVAANAGDPPAPSPAPHVPQNRSPGSLAAPHVGHAAARALPH